MEKYLSRINAFLSQEPVYFELVRTKELIDQIEKDTSYILSKEEDSCLQKLKKKVTKWAIKSLNIELRSNQFIVEVDSVSKTINLLSTGRKKDEIDEESFLTLQFVLQAGGINLDEEAKKILRKF